MTETIITTGAIIWAACSFWLGWLLWTAPEGWEDSAGYHTGQQPDAELDTPRSETGAPGSENDAGGVLVDNLLHGGKR